MAETEDTTDAPPGKKEPRHWKRRWNIPHLPGESAKDYSLRADRERKRILQAEKRLVSPRRNHPVCKIREGESREEYDKRRHRENVDRHREKHADKLAHRRRELYALNGAGETKKTWIKANADKIKASGKAYFERNREWRLSKLKAWGAANPEKVKELRKAYNQANRHKYTAAHAKRRAKAVMATPPWVDWKEIENVYAQAKKMTRKTGIEHQVDHIVPLNGKNVRGLHVPWNLQVLTKAENIKKRDKLDLSLLASLS